MTTADKLTYIQGQCMAKSCAQCKLDNGTTCPRPHHDWKYCTPEEIETAYNILFSDSKEPEFVKAGDSVEHPLHYCKGGVECIDAIRASMTKEAFAGYCKGNVMKYIFRYEQKGGKESLEKAAVYLKWLIEAEAG